MTQKEILITLARLNSKGQNEIFEKMKKNGLTEQDVQVLKKMLFYYKLYSDKTFYDATVEAMGTKIYNEIKEVTL